ncbi:hypothetical protein NC652_001968 [Populus alba x Populus x berolinensis]|nr:hypothetical protein NC652_001968 [Populus alba x Populus x berolinensis]
MLEGKARIEDTDMPMKMQIQAMASASQALDFYDVLDCKSIAARIKKESSREASGREENRYFRIVEARKNKKEVTGQLH